MAMIDDGAPPVALVDAAWVAQQLVPPTGQDIAALKHAPGFPEARRAGMRFVLGVLGGNALANVVMSDRSRFVLAALALVLHHARFPGDPETGLTVTRLRRWYLETGLGSAARASAGIALLRWAGYLESIRDPNDNRRKILVPTQRFLDMHKSRWRANLEIVATIIPDIRGVLALVDRPAFAPTFAVAQATQYFSGFRFVEHAPELKPFMDRSAGFAILLQLASSGEELQAAAPNAVVPLSVYGLARRFGVSRAQVHRVLRAAEEAGLLKWRDRSIEVLPPLRDAFGSFFAAAFLFNAACARVAAAAARERGTS
jgi:DNA-binding MarR family transcriptional regulator